MTYKNIQGMRAVAALIVFLAHVFYPIVPMRTHPLMPWVDAVGPGGVDIFFVISGFIICTVVSRTAQSTGSTTSLAWRFVLKRMIRIYPVYWIVFALATLAIPYAELSPNWIEHRSWWTQALLIAQPNDRILAAWTLVYEFYFYIVAAVALLIWRQNPLLPLLVWFAAIGILQLSGSSLVSTTYASPILFEFLFGVAVAWLVERGYIGFGLFFTVAGTAALAFGALKLHRMGGWFGTGMWVRTICFGLPSAFIIYGMIVLERQKKWVVPVFMQRIGDASYSLYICHQLIFAVLAALLIRYGVIDTLPREVYAVLFLLIGFIVGMAVHRYVERPILDRLGLLLVGERVRISALPA